MFQIMNIKWWDCSHHVVQVYYCDYVFTKAYIASKVNLNYGHQMMRLFSSSCTSFYFILYIYIIGGSNKHNSYRIYMNELVWH